MTATGATVGVSIQAMDAPGFVAQVRQAEDAGIRVAWTTIGGAGGADPLTVAAAALTATDSIDIGTAIIPTWPRHPIILAQQAQALEQLAPGRLRLGIGPSHEPMMTSSFGVEWSAPLTNLREYLQVIRSLLSEGSVDFEGRHVTARSRIREPYEVTLMASALRPRSFETCGELTDGAISWMCPKQFLIEEALPAVTRGAERAGRATPPLIAHVPMLVTEDRGEVRRLIGQLGRYAEVPFYRAMFEAAGYDVNDGYSDELLADLVVSGSEAEVAERLGSYIEAGCGEVLAAPLIDPEDREGSFERAFSAIARADASARG
ncbi:MAG: LLM class flavin-dependent oxidoreductase [Dehalococcoidia bacterium]|jgi:F420-dependent oxidoreductase-like protein|nr:LLM class flavin-dependent oxidoreductase [Dehalococcoidia bacterium]